LPGTTIDPLLEKLFWGCFINCGQTCAALKRLYVHADQYEEVVGKFAAYVSTIPVGNGMDPRYLIGPLTNQMQLQKVAAYVEDARVNGARIVTGGAMTEGPGYFYPLTVVADATDNMLIVREEQFGPAIPILKYQTIEEALARANSLNTGLGGSVWGNNLQSATELATRLEGGTAWVNQHGALHPMAPFGGIKASGVGVEFNVDGLREYTTVQVLNVSR
jgi:acyl-CoA reductase-like NAD-dependent aldehyde dehydrogenase